jgi:hypothetical protein
MAYTDEYDLFATTGNDLHKKVARAVDKAARDVINEDVGTENHDIRYAWAKWIRANPDRITDEAHRIMMHVLDNATVSAAGNAATDSDVQFVVNGLVNTISVGGYK